MNGATASLKRASTPPHDFARQPSKLYTMMYQDSGSFRPRTGHGLSNGDRILHWDTGIPRS